jgi:hypothetical protein
MLAEACSHSSRIQTCATQDLHLADRPRFGSAVDSISGTYEIGAEHPKQIQLQEWKDELLGQMIHHICGSAMLEFEEKPQILENIKTRRYSFIYNDKGEFMADHMDLIEADESN